MIDTEPVTAVIPQTRGRRIRRALWCLPLLLAVTYAALPLWLPTSWIALQIADELSANLQRPVQVGHMHVGWIDGVVLEDIRVAERADQPNEYLARIRQIRCPFKPLTSLFKKLDRVELIGPQLWLVFDDAGRITNVADLAHSRGGRLPSYEFTISGGICHLVMPDRTQEVRADHLECNLQPGTGLLQLWGWTTIHRQDVEPSRSRLGRFSVDAELTVTRLRRDRTLGGEVQLEWRDLAVTDLPFPLAAKLPIRQLEGDTTGRLTLSPQPDLGVDFDLYIEFDGVRIQRVGLERPSVVPDAVVAIAGHWDPNIEVIVLNKFDYETPAIHLRRASQVPGGLHSVAVRPTESEPLPALRIDARGESPFQMHLAGRIKDWAALRREFPEVDAFGDAIGATTAGSAEFSLSVCQHRRHDRLILDLNATKSDWLVSGSDRVHLSASAGIPKRLQLDVLNTRPPELLIAAQTQPADWGATTPLSEPALRVSVGDVVLSARGRMPLPPRDNEDKLAWFANAWPAMQGELEIDAGHLEEAVEFFPALAAWGLEGSSGRCRAGLSLLPEDRSSRLQLKVAVPAASALSIGDVFRKLPGMPLSVKAGLLLSHAADGRISEPDFEIECGPSRLKLDPQAARLTSSFSHLPPEGTPPQPAVRIEAAYELPVQVTAIQHLLALCPRWSAAADLRDALRGSAELNLSGRLSYRPGDWVLSSELRLRGDGLTIGFGDILDKPAGRALSLALSHRHQRLDQRREDSLDAQLVVPGSRLTASLVFGQDPPAADAVTPARDFEHAGVHAQIDDLPSFLAMFPSLARRIEPHHLAGKLQLELAHTLLANQQMLSIRADAGEADLSLPGTELHKPAGTPARLAMEWSTDVSDPDSAPERWRLTHATAQMAGVELSTGGGEARLAWEHTPLTAARSLLQRSVSRPALQAASLRAAGSVQFDPDLAGLHPQLREWFQSYGLGGLCKYELQLTARPGSLDCRGRVDAREAGLRLKLPEGQAVSTVQKPPGVHALLHFDLGVSRAPAAVPTEPAANEAPTSAAGYAVQVRDLTFELAGNTFAAMGQFVVDRDGHALAPGDFDLNTEFELRRAGDVAALLPDARFAPEGGQAAGSLRLVRSNQRLSVPAARCSFSDFLVGTPAEPVRLVGELSLGRQQLSADKLSWSWGASRGSVSGHLQYAAGGADITTGRVGLDFENLDLLDLGRRVASIPKPAAQAGPAAGPLPRLLAVLPRTSITLDASARSVRTALPLDVIVTLEAGAATAVARQGPLSTSFRCIVDGGSVTGNFEIGGERPDPTYRLTYSANRIQPGELVDNYLKLTFPGMRAAGALTLIDESNGWLTGPAASQYPTGSGEMFIEGGYVEGRAAPEWVTRIFPGLNLARFDFSYMHSWFEKSADGRCRHQMIYSGKYYNIYMIGYSTADGFIDYEVGIDFLADFDSKYWAESGQGRIPLFTKTGRRLPDGSLADELVTYSTPRRVFEAVFVNNNPVVTAYHAVRKRVLKEN